ncbi:DUF2293 domain-containing protein [Hirschia litorea]|uniref:DUF2293 domain-containing protein n=1 Tax=Hirschia litorea TaxID=1199156 RepID=A0ABW2IKU1_9PROT
MSKFFPKCPVEYRDAIVEMASSKEFDGIDIKTATAMCARTFVRRNLTDFEDLKQIDAMTRTEALIIVKSEVADIIQTWK